MCIDAVNFLFTLADAPSFLEILTLAVTLSTFCGAWRKAFCVYFLNGLTACRLLVKNASSFYLLHTSLIIRQTLLSSDTISSLLPHFINQDANNFFTFFICSVMLKNNVFYLNRKRKLNKLKEIISKK